MVNPMKLHRISAVLAATLLAGAFVPAHAQPKDAPSEKAPPKGTLPAPKLPPGAKVMKDIPYVADGHERQKLDLYIPPGASNAPLVVWIHGGGWQNGGKDRTPALPLLEKGFAVASINYRLSSHAVFPAQIEDCKAAVRWLRAHAKKHHIDPERIGVWGASAGGHLVALLGVTGDVKEFDTGERTEVSSRVQAVADFFGPAELFTMQQQSRPGGPINHDAPDAPEAKLIGGALPDNKAKADKASPITYVSKGDAPILIVHGDQDPLVPLQQSVDFHAKLKKAGVDAELLVMKGAGHGFRDAQGVEANQKVEAFFIRVLKPGK
jgi:acetyl esterase/lipase